MADSLSFLFTDIEGSTRLWEAHPEVMGATIARHDSLLTEVVEDHGGSVFKLVGDAVHAVFTSPEAAAAAAIAAQLAVEKEPWPDATPLRVRAAVHTGTCEPRDGDYYGPTLNRLARLVSIGHGGQTLVSGTTAALVRSSVGGSAQLSDLGLHRLKDLGTDEHVFELCPSGRDGLFPPLRSLPPVDALAVQCLDQGDVQASERCLAEGRSALRRQPMQTWSNQWA